MNQFNTVQKSRQQVLRAYSPNKYTVLQGQTNSQNNIWTVPRLESTQTQTNLPSYENVVCQQNYEFEEFCNPPSYNDAMVSGQWNYDQNSGATQKGN